jgi:hypothetical protein
MRITFVVESALPDGCASITETSLARLTECFTLETTGHIDPVFGQKRKLCIVMDETPYPNGSLLSRAEGTKVRVGDVVLLMHEEDWSQWRRHQADPAAFHEAWLGQVTEVDGRSKSSVYCWVRPFEPHMES